MTDVPHPSRDTMDSMVTVRPATERDFPAIARIQQASPEAAQWPVGDYSGFETLLAFIDDQPAGFAAWRRLSPEESELLNLAVHPDFRRRGVASALLTTLIEAAKTPIFLEVAEPNLPAQALYRTHGWKPVSIRRNYYDQGRVNAVVMKKSSW